MGAAASLVRKHAVKSIRNYNVEERAMKMISKDKPTPAPPHPAMKEIMDEIMKDPTKLKSSRTDPQFLKNLSDVYITSTGVNPSIKPKTLPVNREPPEDSTFGYEEPKVIPPGKASLRQILEFVADHSKEPETHTAEIIAKKYNLDIVDVMNILQYTRTLLMFSQPKSKAERDPNPLRRLQDSIDNLKR